jgi:signal transduction histidine kinase
VKLSSTARLRIVTLAITTILTATIGTFVSQQSYNSSIRTIDRTINFTIEDAAASPGEELSAALFHIEDYSLDQALFLISRDGTSTLVNQSTINLFDELALSQVKAATKNVSAGFGASEFRFRSLLISGGDYLVVAATSADALETYHSNIVSVVFVTILTSLLAYLLLLIYTRRLKKRDDEDALARMQAFLGDASHELRTPLTVIKGYVEMLSNGMLQEENDRSRAFSRVTNEIGRMETLIHDLLLLAELGESGNREIETVDLSEITAAHMRDFITLNPVRKVKLALDAHVEVDLVPEYFLRFLQNALNNIDIHTKSTDPVLISLSKHGKFATLTIEDGGPGLPESAYKEHIQSLSRFDKSRSRENGGSGLGMSIMAAVISKSGGELTLRKSSLGGLAVVANIPRHRQ